MEADASGALPMLRRLTKVLRQGTPEAKQEAAAVVHAISSHGDNLMNQALVSEPGLIHALHALCAIPRSKNQGLCSSHPIAVTTLRVLGALDAIQGRLGCYPEW